MQRTKFKIMTEKRKETLADELLADAKNLLSGIQSFKDREEYSTINMNLKTICAELNKIVIKQITDEDAKGNMEISPEAEIIIKKKNVVGIVNQK